MLSKRSRQPAVANTSAIPRDSLMRGGCAADGLTLVESLIALVILSIGLLGLAGMQLNSMQATQNAQMRTEAFQLASALADRMRANRANCGAYAFNGNKDKGSAVELTAGDNALQVSAQPRVTNDLQDWWPAVDDALPAARADIDVVETGPGSRNHNVTIRLDWKADRRDTRNSGDDNTARRNVRLETWL